MLTKLIYYRQIIGVLVAISRHSSGEKQLNDVIEGGFPRGSVIAYVGNSGTNKRISGMRFIHEGYLANSGTLIVTTTLLVSKYHDLAKRVGVDVTKSIFIDAANWKVQRIDRSQISPSPYHVSNLTDLNALLAIIVQACTDNEVDRILFDSPSSLLIYSTPSSEQVFRFFELLTAFTRNKKITLVYLLEDDIHSLEVKSTLLFLSDGEIKFRYEPGNGKTQVLPVSLWFTDIATSWIELD